jgi:tryptophan halogenase
MKIVIVGGGTAGWIAALFLAQKNKRADGLIPYDITVIESPKIPIIGAGEGSTGAMVGLLKDKLRFLEGINQHEFLKKSNGTIKLGINVKDWNGDGKNFLEPLQPTSTSHSNLDIDFLLASTYGEPHFGSATGVLWNENLIPFYSSSTKNIDDGGGFAYHFDAHKVGQYFKEVALENGVNYISAEVVDVDVEPESGKLLGVELDNNTVVLADLWFDCSGFNRTLINSVGGKWKSYSHFLPCDRAMPYIHPYEEGEVIRPETLAWAMPNGWMWQIPTQERYGCGYVYSSKFVSDEQALKEMEEITGRKINPIRVLEFEPGRMENVWVKNVVAVGLSSHFLEPLEATSIHATIVQMDYFCKNHLGVFNEETFYNANYKKFNNFFNEMVDDFANLIRIHYVTKRQDSEFWRYVNNELPKTEKVEEIIEICKYRCPNMGDWKMIPGASGWGVWATILPGLGILTKEVICNTMWNNNLNVDSELMYEQMLSHFLFHKNNFVTHNWLIDFYKNQK